MFDPLRLPPGHSVTTDQVATADTCASCHANTEQSIAMRDSADRPIAPHDLWQSSMMANAGRDPFWHAVVEGEILATPAAAEAIEAKCTRCHAPMLSAELELTGAGTPSMASLYEPDSDHAALALDGVSCTVCHQIEDDELGEPSSFGGGWTIAGERRIYGPHAESFANPMINNVGWTPLEGAHTGESKLCASCHTLFTDALTPSGEATGSTLPEQTPYLEWRNSAFSTEVANPGPAAAECQDCHAPKTSVDGVAISTRIAHRPDGADFPSNVVERSPYGRHVFVGANTLMLGLIRDYAEILQPNASAAAFDATIAATRTQLQQATASLAFGELGREGDSLRIPVTVTNLAGHKLPTSFPSRRVFLAVEVRDADDAVVFASGAFDARGRLLDGAGEVLASELAGGPIAAHLDELTSADQVQIWESVMADDDAQPTYRLLRGASYAKDNRLLPAGWNAQAADPSIAPVATAGDPSFGPASDTVTYVISAPAAAGPYTITARVYYQPLSPRFLAELFALDGPRIRAFEAMIDGVEVTPEQLASAETSVD